MLASLMAQAEAVLGDTVADARDQDYSWAEIAERLDIAGEAVASGSAGP